MTQPKPTTEQLMTMLRVWPVEHPPGLSNSPQEDMGWQISNVLWEWTPQEFEEQTRQLMAQNCSNRDMLAWFVHGVRWVEPEKANVSLKGFDGQIDLWRNKGAYVRAWVAGVNNVLDDDAVRRVASFLDWHPVWGKTGLDAILDDFEWAREVRARPSRVKASRKSLSYFGSLELAHAVNDYDFSFDCVKPIAKNISVLVERGPSGIMPGSTMNVLGRSTLLHTLSPFVQRALLVECAKDMQPGKFFDPNLVSSIRAIWANGLAPTEQSWWEEKCKGLNIARETNKNLLDHGIHPLELLYPQHAHGIALLKDLDPDAFCWGYRVQGFLSQTMDVPLELPDVHSDSLSA